MEGPRSRNPRGTMAEKHKPARAPLLHFCALQSPRARTQGGTLPNQAGGQGRGEHLCQPHPFGQRTARETSGSSSSVTGGRGPCAQRPSSLSSRPEKAVLGRCCGGCGWRFLFLFSLSFSINARMETGVMSPGQLGEKGAVVGQAVQDRGSLSRTRARALAGSVASDPSSGCSSLLKKISYNNNNINFSLCIFSHFFPFLLGIGVGGERTKKQCHSSVRS